MTSLHRCTFFFILILAVFLSACGSAPPTNTTPVVTTPVVTTPVVTTPVVTTPVVTTPVVTTPVVTTPVVTTPLTSTTVIGSVGDGPVIGANITVTDANGFAVNVGAVTSDTYGKYQLSVPAGTLFPLTITSQGGNDQTLVVVGAASTTAASFVAVMQQGDAYANISPLSTLVAAVAQQLGGITTANMATAYQNVVKEMGIGLSGMVWPATTKTSELNFDPYALTSTQYAALLQANEAIGEIISRTSQVNPNVTVNNVINSIAFDLADGLLNGTNANTVSTLPAVTTAALQIRNNVFKDLKINGLIKLGATAINGDGYANIATQATLVQAASNVGRTISVPLDLQNTTIINAVTTAQAKTIPVSIKSVTLSFQSNVVGTPIGNGTDQYIVKVRVTYNNNTVAPNQWVTLTYPNYVGNGIVTIIATANPTDATGTAFFTITDSVALLDTVSVVATVGAVASPPLDLNFSACVGVCGNAGGGALQVTPDFNNMPADGSLVNVTVQTSPNKPVTLTRTTGTISSESIFPTNNTLTADAKGRAVFQVSNRVAESINLTASDGATSATFNYTFIPAVGLINVTATPTSAPADGVTASNVNVLLKTGSLLGQVVANEPIAIFTSGAASTLLATGTTSAAGTFSFPVTDNIAESVTVTVKTRNGGVLPGIVQTGTATINFNDIITDVLFTSSSTNLAADNTTTATLTAVAVNAAQQPLAGSLVKFTTTTGTLTDLYGSPLNPNGVSTDIFGKAEALLKSNTPTPIGTPASVSVSAGAVSKTIPIDFTKVIDIVKSSISASPAGSIAADGVSAATITVKILDVLGAGIAGKTVVFTDPYGSSSIFSKGFSITSSTGFAAMNVTDIVEEIVDIYAYVDNFIMPVSVSFQAPVAQVTLSASVSSIEAKDPYGSSITAKALDGRGVGLANRAITFNITSNNPQGTATLSTFQGVTDLYGSITTTLKSNSKELILVNAISANQKAATAVSVNFTAPVASMTLTVQPASGSVPADGQATATIVVNVKDAGGNPIVNQNVVFSDYTTILTGQASAAQLSASNISTDATGTAQITVVNPVAGSITVRADAGAQVKTGVVNFALTNLQMIVTTPNLPFIANSLPYDVYILVNDQNGVPQPGQTLTLTTDSATASLFPPTVTTDAYGLAVPTIRNSVAEVVNLNILDSTGKISLAVPMTFISANADRVTLSAQPLSVPPNGVSSFTLTATVSDINGTITSNAFVGFSTTDPYAVLSASQALTDANGRAQIQVFSQRSTVAPVTATLSSNPTATAQSATTNIVFEETVTSVVIAVVGSQTVPVDSYVTVQATVFSGANPIPNRTVNFRSSGSGIFTNNATAVTDNKGVATIQVTSAVAETLSVIANASGTDSVAHLTIFTPQVFNLQMSIVPGNVAADNASIATVVVNVKDINGVSISGQAVTFKDLYGSAAQFSASSVVTGLSGTAVVDVINAKVEITTVEVTAGAKTAVSTINFVSPTGLVLEIQAVNPSGPIDPFNIVNPANGIFPAGPTQYSMTVRAKDTAGRPLAQQKLSLSSTSPTMKFTKSPGVNLPFVQLVTDIYGEATVQISNTVAEQVELTLTGPIGKTSVKQIIQFISEKAQTISIIANPASLRNDGTPASLIINVLDGSGAAVPNAFVKLSKDVYSSALLANAILYTDAQGSAITQVSSQVENTAIMTATLPLNVDQFGVNPSASTTVSFGPAVTDLLFSASPLSTEASNQVSFITLSATVLDNGRPLGNRPVTFTTTGSTLLDLASSKKITVNTNLQGVATLTQVSNPVPETVTVTASIDQFVQSLPVTFTPVVASMTVTPFPISASAPADGTTPINLIVTVKDASGTPISGQEVLFADATLNGSAAQLSQASAITNASGTTQIGVTSPTGGGVAIRVSAGSTFVPTVVNLNFSQLQTLQIKVLSPSLPVMTNAISDNYGTIQILAQDTKGQPLSGQSLILGKNSGTLVFSQNPISSNANGIAIVEVRNSIPENVDITITDNAGALLTTIPTQFVADRAQAITMSVTPNSVLPNGIATATIVATVRDQVGAAVPNAFVEFTTIANGVVDPYAVISIPSAMTNALGQVSATVTRTQPGVANITTSLSSNIVLYNSLVNRGLLTQTQIDYIAGFQGSTVQAVNFEDPVSSITLETTLNNVSADGTTQALITATVRSISGQLLSNRPVIFTSAPAALTASNVNTGIVGANVGLATTLVSHNVAELITVTATAGGITQTLGINFTPVVSSVLLAKDPTQTGMKANGLDTYNITAQALDPYGVGIPNAVITFAGTGIGITAITPSTGVTDAAGLLVATVSDLYSGGEVVQVVAEASQKLSAPLGLAFDPTSSSSSVASLSVAASQFSILTDNSDSAVITATVLDQNNAVVTGVVVSFSSDGGQLSAGTAVTDLSGVARINLSSGTSDQSNRIITISANVFSSAGGAFTSSTSVLTTGTTLLLNSSTTGLDANGLSAPLTVILKNAGGQPIAASVVNISYVAFETVAPFSSVSFGVPIGARTFVGTTDVAGQFVVDVYGTAVGSLNVIASGAGAVSSVIYNISNLGGSFAIIAPVINPYSLSTNVALPISVRSPNASPVTLATSFGVFSNGLSVIDIPVPAGFPGAGFPTGTWTAIDQLTASQAGMATIQAFDRNDPTVSDTMTVAVSAPAANASSVSLQSNIGVIAPNIGAGGDSAILTATVRDGYGQPVGNAEVIFEILNPTGGGEIVSPAIGITNSTGNIITTFTSGVQSSGATGVNVKASVVQAGVPSPVITSQTNIVIGGTAASVVIGIGSKITQLSVTEYQLPMSVMVADSNGNPVTNSQVTLSVWPAKYSTGAWAKDINGQFFANITNTLVNEDVNENLIIDPGEDLNADGTLTPPSTSSGTIPSIVFTDANGVANFNLIYQKQSAEWIVARVRASILAQGSEAAGQLVFRLPHAVADEGSLPDSPFSKAVGNISIVPVAQMLPIASSTPVTIQVRDTRGVVVANAPVTVDVTGSATIDGYTLPTSYTTDSNGNISVIVTDSVAENVNIQVTKSGQIQTLTMYFGAEVRLFSQSNIVLADGLDAHNITVQTLDSTGNAIASMPVSFSNVSSGIINIIPDATVVTNPNGELITDNTGVIRAKVTDLFNLGESVQMTAISGQISSAPALQLPFTAITGVPTVPAQLAVTADKFSVKTGGVDTSVISVVVQDDRYAVIANTTVSFTTTGGLLTANSAVTDAYGRASVSFTSGIANASNRTEVITVQAAGNSSLQASIPILVDGSTIAALTQQTTLTIGGAVDVLTVTIQDSAGTAVYNEPVLFTVSPEITLSVLSGLTNIQGQLSVNVSGVAAGLGTVTATSLNAIVVQSYQVANIGNAFGITAPTVDPYGMSITDIYTVSVFAPAGVQTVAFSASVGSWVGSTLPGYLEVAVPTPLTGGTVTADVYSSTSGVDVIQVFDVLNPNTKDTVKIIWSAPVNAATQMQLQTSSASLLRSAVGGVQNQATITAKVLDVNNQPVSGVGVTFAIQNATNSGELLSNVFATTSAAGIATTKFTSGTSSSGNNGVNIVATVVSTTLVLIPQKTVNITIAGTAASVAIGYAVDSIGSPTPATYSLPFTILVSDSVGAAVAGAVVSLGLWPETYMLGNWLPVLSNIGATPCTFAYNAANYAAGPLLGDVCNPNGLPKTVYTLGLDAYSNEDLNRNLVLDIGEDINLDGALTPGIAMAGTIPLTVTTDANGLATFDLIYLKTYAPWIEDRITATTSVLGTEMTSSLLFTLPVRNSAIIVDGSPPAPSPFGQ